MKIPILAWLLQGIPECIATASLVYYLGTGKINPRTILTIGILQAVLAYLIRLFPFTPGVHTIILITVLATLSIYIGKVEFKRAFILSFLAFVVLIICEIFFMFFLTYVLHFPMEQLSGNLPVRIAIGYPQIILLFIFILIFYKKNITFDTLFRRWVG